MSLQHTVPEEIERDVLVFLWPVIILAVHDLGLRWMKLKAALRKAYPDGFQNRPRLLLTPAVDDGIVSKPLERIVRESPLHPRIEPVMQKEIRQERACYALNAKDNFQFERKIRGWRQRRGVLDLRRKQ